MGTSRLLLRLVAASPLALVAALLVSLAGAGGCRPPGDRDPAPAFDGAGGDAGDGGGDAARALSSGAPARLVAFDEAHALVVVDDEGELLARRELGAGVATDVIEDPLRGRLLVLMEREEDHARVLEVSWDGEHLGAPVEVATTGGRARIALIQEGILVASDLDGPRVRLIRHDGAPTRGRALSPPRSWWSDDTLGFVHGLELPPGGEATRFTLGVDAEGSAAIVERRPLAIAAAEARLVEVAAGDERLVTLDEENGTLTLRSLPSSGSMIDAPSVALTGEGGSAVQRLEGVAAWPVDPAEGPPAGCGGDSRGLAIATGEPARLLVTTLDGELLTRLDLPANPPSGGPYGRRDLAVVDGTLLVATAAGVIAVRGGQGAQAITRDDAFEGDWLSGPLLCLPR
jgi:hypothetical protein